MFCEPDPDGAPHQLNRLMQRARVTGGVERAVADVTEAEIDVRRPLRAVLQHFEADGLRYLIQRNYEHFPDRSFRRDIGILVDHRDVGLLTASFARGCAAAEFSTGWKRASGNIIMFARPLGAAGGSSQEALKFDARTYEAFAPPRRLVRTPAHRVLLSEFRRRRVEQGGSVFHVPAQPDEMILLYRQWRRKGLTRHQIKLAAMLHEGDTRAWFLEATGLSDSEVESLLSNPRDERHVSLLWKMASHRWEISTSRMIANLLRTTMVRFQGRMRAS
jgi:hypothetical protein